MPTGGGWCQSHIPHIWYLQLLVQSHSHCLLHNLLSHDTSAPQSFSLIHSFTKQITIEGLLCASAILGKATHSAVGNRQQVSRCDKFAQSLVKASSRADTHLGQCLRWNHSVDSMSKGPRGCEDLGEVDGRR
jgi:hypothetical protein